MKQACERDDADAVERWLDAGNSPDARHDIRGRCTCAMPLIGAAAYDGAEAVVRLLISRGADVNAQAEGQYGALFNAVSSNYKLIVKILLMAGARDTPSENGDKAEDVAEMIAAPADAAPPLSKGDPTCLRLLRQYAPLSREQQVAAEVARRKANLAAGYAATPKSEFPSECATLLKNGRARIHSLVVEPEGLKTAPDGSRRSVGLLNECVAVLLDDGDQDGWHFVSVRFGEELEVLRIHRRCLKPLSVKIYQMGQRIDYRRNPEGGGTPPVWKAGCVTAVDRVNNSQGKVINVKYSVALDAGGSAVCNHTELRQGRSRLEIAFDAFGAAAIARGALSSEAFDAAARMVAACGADLNKQQEVMERCLEQWLPAPGTSVVMADPPEYRGKRGVLTYPCDEDGRRLRGSRGLKPLLWAVELPGSVEGGVLVHPQALDPWTSSAASSTQTPPPPGTKRELRTTPAVPATPAVPVVPATTPAVPATPAVPVVPATTPAVPATPATTPTVSAKKRKKKKKKGGASIDGDGDEGGGERGRDGGADGDGEGDGKDGHSTLPSSTLCTAAGFDIHECETPAPVAATPVAAAPTAPVAATPVAAAPTAPVAATPVAAAPTAPVAVTPVAAAPPASEDVDEVCRLLADLTAACDEHELRAALVAATPYRTHPLVEAELPEARKRLKAFKRERQREQAEPRGAATAEEPCSICMDGVRTHAFVPCGHKALCQSCCETRLGGLTACPLCRAGFQQVIRVYE